MMVNYVNLLPAPMFKYITWNHWDPFGIALRTRRIDSRYDYDLFVSFYGVFV